MYSLAIALPLSVVVVTQIHEEIVESEVIDSISSTSKIEQYFFLILEGAVNDTSAKQALLLRTATLISKMTDSKSSETSFLLP